MKRIMTALLITSLSGCAVTLDHQVELKDTSSRNDLVIETCTSHSLNKLNALEPLDVERYKKRKDIKGLLKALATRNKEQRLLGEVALGETSECFEYQPNKVN